MADDLLLGKEIAKLIRILLPALMSDIEPVMISAPLMHPKTLVDFAHTTPHSEFVHAAREAHFLAKTAERLENLTTVDLVKDMAAHLKNSAKQVEFMARKVSCMLGFPVSTTAPHLPVVAASIKGHFLLTQEKLDRLEKKPIHSEFI